MTNSELFERLAFIEHERWCDWQRWMHKIGTRNPDGSLTLNAVDVARWDRQIETVYSELSEQEKESDRDQVRRYWSLIKRDE